ncbi:MAG: SurA N-terminal domain-containing protein, partial [Candidatus Omnitrophica bacterium]|nr:SurA N-terminal domain-containing protein [Candidatus Omnitrophota bacterium]
MLKFLREKGVMKKILWVTAIVIILSFGFLGTASYWAGSRESKYAGKVFGKKVSLSEFQENYDQVRLQALIRYGDQFDQVKDNIDFISETWDRIILMREAQKRRIQVTDEEVVEYIQNYPFFQKNGQFDTLLYNDILRYVFKQQPRQFEESIR